MLYACFALLLGALVFGVVISNIGTLISSLDRQAAMVEEKLDAVKEYTLMRKLNKSIAGRVRKHFKYYVDGLLETRRDRGG